MKKLEWKYCECGCHQHSLTLGSRHFTYYQPLNGNSDLFSEGHDARGSQYSTKVKGFDEADKLVMKACSADFEQLMKVFKTHERRHIDTYWVIRDSWGNYLHAWDVKKDSVAFGPRLADAVQAHQFTTRSDALSLYRPLKRNGWLLKLVRVVVYRKVRFEQQSGEE